MAYNRLVKIKVRTSSLFLKRVLAQKDFHFVSQIFFFFPSSHRLEGKKVKYTLVQALRLCTDRTAHRGSRGIAVLFHDHGTRRGWGVSVTPRPLFTPGKDPVLIAQEAGWAPRPVWTGAENLAPTGIRSPDRPPRSQSLYRLRYPAHLQINPLNEELTL